MPAGANQGVELHSPRRTDLEDIVPGERVKPARCPPLHLSKSAPVAQHHPKLFHLSPAGLHRRVRDGRHLVPRRASPGRRHRRVRNHIVRGQRWR